jgi:hypothetical protein
MVERETIGYSKAEVVFADALAAGIDEKIVAAARVRLGANRGDVTAEMAKTALRDALAGIEKLKKELQIGNQPERVNELRKRGGGR